MQEKSKLINQGKHHVLMAPHPSGRSTAAKDTFLGCGHFSKANALLEKQGKTPIDWQIEKI